MYFASANKRVPLLLTDVVVHDHLVHQSARSRESLSFRESTTNRNGWVVRWAIRLSRIGLSWLFCHPGGARGASATISIRTPWNTVHATELPPSPSTWSTYFSAVASR